MSNAITQLAKILKNKVVLSVGGQKPINGDINMIAYAARDKNNSFSGVQTFAGGVGNISVGAYTDFNDIDVSGWYRSTGSKNYSSTLNIPPFKQGCLLLVIGEGTQFRTQMAWSVASDQKMAIRFGNTTTKTYSPWQLMATKDEISDLNKRVSELENKTSEV